MGGWPSGVGVGGRGAQQQGRELVSSVLPQGATRVTCVCSTPRLPQPVLGGAPGRWSPQAWVSGRAMPACWATGGCCIPRDESRHRGGVGQLCTEARHNPAPSHSAQRASQQRLPPLGGEYRAGAARDLCTTRVSGRLGGAARRNAAQPGRRPMAPAAQSKAGARGRHARGEKRICINRYNPRAGRIRRARERWVPD